MSTSIFWMMAVAGGLGAALRLALGAFLAARHSSSLPLGTMAINLSGSMSLGLVTGLCAHGPLSPTFGAVIGTGLLGGYTTFSAASLETVRLLQERRFAAAVGNGLGVLVVATAAAAFGTWLGRLR